MAIDRNSITWDDGPDLSGVTWDEPAKAPAPSMLKQFASAAVRPIAKGVAGLPLMAMDAGVAARNLAMGSKYQLPSDMFNHALDSYTLPPEGVAGKGAEFVSSMLAGSRMSMPTAKPGNAQLMPRTSAADPGLPSVAAKPVMSQRDLTLAAGRAAGYVVPPATTNPTVGNKVLESIGGKIATAQDAAIQNQGVTNRLARSSLGLSDDTELSRGALDTLRKQASGAYQEIRNAGQIKADPQFSSDLAAITAKYRGAAKDFPDLAKTDVADIVKSVEKSEFSADSAVDAISILRDKADAAYAAGDKGLGKAYKSVSSALESVIERNLQAQGATDALKRFRDARQLIAKTYSVEKALNEGSGNVNAVKLAQQLARGKPLSGPLKTAASFGEAFPKASREILDSGSVRNTDVILGAGTAALSREPSYLLYPFLRQGVRAGLLSDAGQGLTQPGSWNPSGRLPYGLMPQLRGLLGQ